MIEAFKASSKRNYEITVSDKVIILEEVTEVKYRNIGSDFGKWVEFVHEGGVTTISLEDIKVVNYYETF